MSTSKTVDVVVIGAGISGLSAARYLVKKDPNLQVLVLEGKDRVGGRTLTVPLKTATGTDKWDAGAQWVGRSQEHIMGLLGELGLETHQQYLAGAKVLQLGLQGTLKTYTSAIPSLNLLALLDLDRTMKKIDSFAREVNPADPYACRRAKEWDNMTFETFINQNMWTADGKELMQQAINCIIGVEGAQISTLFFLSYVAAAGGLKLLTESTEYAAQEYRVKGGTQQISQLMAKELGDSRVFLNEGVCSITQTTDNVTIRTVKGNTYECKRAILAIPPPQKGKIKFEPELPTISREIIKRMPMANYGKVLITYKEVELYIFSGKIKFEPELPTISREIIKRMPMANFGKVLITYKEAFWRAAGKSGESVTNGGPSSKPRCAFGPLCMTFDDVSENGNPALVAFIVGQQLVEWRQVEAEARKKAVLKTLCQFYGEQCQDYIEYREMDWDSEAYIEGAPIAAVAPGAMKFYKDGLVKPWERLHFAGTETASVWTGYMSGAVQAGHRAAMEVLQHLNPKLVSEQDLQDNNRPFKGAPKGSPDMGQPLKSSST